VAVHVAGFNRPNAAGGCESLLNIFEMFKAKADFGNDCIQTSKYSFQSELILSLCHRIIRPGRSGSSVAARGARCKSKVQKQGAKHASLGEINKHYTRKPQEELPYETKYLFPGFPARGSYSLVLIWGKHKLLPTYRSRAMCNKKMHLRLMWGALTR
jgi:hypothetical protein